MDVLVQIRSVGSVRRTQRIYRHRDIEAITCDGRTLLLHHAEESYRIPLREVAEFSIAEDR